MKIKRSSLGAILPSIASIQAQAEDGIIRLSEFSYPAKKLTGTVPDVWPNVGVQETGREGVDAVSFAGLLKSDKVTQRIILYVTSTQVLTALPGLDKSRYEIGSTFIRSDKHSISI